MSKNCRCSFYFDNYHIKSLIKSNVVKYLTDLGIIPVVYCQKATQIDAATTYEIPKKKKRICKFRKPKFEELIGNKGDIILDLMPKKVATLRTGQMMKIPIRLQILCNFVLKNAEVEEIFIKPGNQPKQEMFRFASILTSMTIRFSKICKCTYFFDNFQNKSIITQNVTTYLTNLGIEPATYKENETHVDATTSYEKPKHSLGADKKPPNNKDNLALDKMPSKLTTLRTGQTMKVPAKLHQLCNFVLRNTEVKKLFKKSGNKTKQEDIKAVLNKGEALPIDTNAVDVAQIILQFLKELPVPVIPECQHQFLLTCYDHADREDVLPLACLLLPPNHVNLLAYLMQFFEQISTHHKKNRMTLTTLGKCVGPLIMPVNAPEDIKKVANIMVTLMKRADLIGMVPELMTLDPKPSRRKRSWVESLLNRY